MPKDKKRDREEEVTEKVDNDIDEEEAARKAAKKAKKAAKKAAKAAAKGVDDSSEAEEVVVEEKKSKKDKKDKSGSSSTFTENVSLYVEHRITANMTSSEVDAHRKELSITVTPEEDAAKFKPLTSFECIESSLQGNCPYIMKYLKDKKFAKPSPIQSECWAPLLSGRDVVGIAATGSGKTLGFLIPGLLRIDRLKALSKGGSHSGKPAPKILIVAPTRELAMQSHQVVEEMGGPLGVCIYGGVPKGVQKAALQAGAEIVVATPGRLMDLLEENALTLSKVCYLVLDEADRM
jgi:ATP-dependent RNA helicase DBP3